MLVLPLGLLALAAAAFALAPGGISHRAGARPDQGLVPPLSGASARAPATDARFAVTGAAVSGGEHAPSRPRRADNAGGDAVGAVSHAEGVRARAVADDPGAAAGGAARARRRQLPSPMRRCGRSGQRARAFPQACWRSTSRPPAPTNWARRDGRTWPRSTRSRPTSATTSRYQPPARSAGCSSRPPPGPSTRSRPTPPNRAGHRNLTTRGTRSSRRPLPARQRRPRRLAGGAVRL